MAEIKPGDVVTLNSDGPRMTVMRVYGTAPALTAHCAWFVAFEFRCQDFAVAALQLTPKNAGGWS